MSAHALAALTIPGELRRASELATLPDSTGLAVSPELSALLPWRGLRRGTTVAVAAGATAGATSLVLALLAGASQAGAWCALVGAANVSAAAAAQAGIQLSRLALVPEPGGQWEAVTAALLDGIDIVAVYAAAAPSPKKAQRLAARARRRGTLLVPFGPAARGWPTTDVSLAVERIRWHGLRRGAGLLRHCELRVESRFHGRSRQATVWPYGKPDRPARIEVQAKLAPVISLSDRRQKQKEVTAGARTRGAVS